MSRQRTISENPYGPRVFLTRVTNQRVQELRRILSTLPHPPDRGSQYVTLHQIYVRESALVHPRVKRELVRDRSEHAQCPSSSAGLSPSSNLSSCRPRNASFSSFRRSHIVRQGCRSSLALRAPPTSSEPKRMIRVRVRHGSEEWRHTAGMESGQLFQMVRLLLRHICV